jgi:hypothetical protein
MNGESTGVPAHEHGAADHDEAYTWGLAPTMYLSQRQIARMIVFRSRLEDRRMLRNRTSPLPPRPEPDC